MTNARKNLRKVRDGLAGLLEEGVDAVSDASRKVAERGRQIHESVQERGGYGSVIKEGLHNVSEAIASATNNYIDRADELYAQFKDEFYTPEGELDYEKVKAIAGDKAAAVKRFGKESVDKLVELTSSGASKAVTAWNYLVPTREERETVYSGIGSEYSGMLLRPDFEKCLDFYNDARKTLPGGLKFRGEILDTIKAYCCTSSAQLLDLYEQRSGENNSSFETVKKYFSRD